ncbi:MAG: hypothetical protein AAF487_06665 [Bacteroidota bacterium]
MEYHNKEELLALFWKGETNADQERELYEFFNGDSGGGLAESKAYFNYLYHERNHNGLGLDFDQRVLQDIKGKKSNSLGILVRIAAGFILLFGIYMFVKPMDPPVNPVMVEDTYDDPEKAYAEVKKALFLLSGEMNTSKGYGGELKKFSKAKKEIRTRKLNIQK